MLTAGLDWEIILDDLRIIEKCVFIRRGAYVPFELDIAVGIREVDEGQKRDW